MKISDITPSISDMSDEELHEFIRNIRHRREVSKPATAARGKKAVAKSSKKQTSHMEALLSFLTDEQLEELLKAEENG